MIDFSFVGHTKIHTPYSRLMVSVHVYIDFPVKDQLRHIFFEYLFESIIPFFIGIFNRFIRPSHQIYTYTIYIIPAAWIWILKIAGNKKEDWNQRLSVDFSPLWRRRRDLNPRCGFPHYSLSRGAPSATWVLLHTDCGPFLKEKWRREWDSNPRLLRVTGFQDRLLKPLGHLSTSELVSVKRQIE